MASSVTIAILVSLTLVALAVYRITRRHGSLGRVGAYDPKTGIGRGAPGFQTNVTRIAVPAHIVARIRAGEDVSAEEITAAQEAEARRAEKEARAKAQGRIPKSAKGAASANSPVGVEVNEWIPQGHDSSPGGAARRTKGKRR
ncbi:unnamed protein product [Parajaminaea phylloscopi]